MRTPHALRNPALAMHRPAQAPRSERAAHPGSRNRIFVPFPATEPGKLLFFPAHRQPELAPHSRSFKEITP